MSTKEKTSLLILFGGMSSEHEVSCASAASVLEHIDRSKYRVYTIGITKRGDWFLTGSPVARIGDGSWEQDADLRRAFIAPDRSAGGVLVSDGHGSWERLGIDVVFPVLHGRNGEDGTIQGLMTLAGIPFVGSGVVASAAAMDKAVTKTVIESSRVAEQAKYCIIHRSEYDADGSRQTRRVLKFFEGAFPLFVKPANAGSSIGISKAKSDDELMTALEKAFAEDEKALVEEAIVGREIEVAVLGNDPPEASCVGEIFAANEFYDYDAKYENTRSATGIVRDLDKDKENEIRDKAVRIYNAVGCEDLARVDFFLEESGRVVFNEINTLPGFTRISMYPVLWQESGIPYDELIDRLITSALEKNKR